jgi:TusA-related sulfurtransferase
MRAVTAGCEVEVLATDPLAAEDVRAYCAATGNKLLQSEANTFGVWRFLIRKC